MRSSERAMEISGVVKSGKAWILKYEDTDADHGEQHEHRHDEEQHIGLTRCGDE
jgi:hypothetical protein